MSKAENCKRGRQNPWSNDGWKLTRQERRIDDDKQWHLHEAIEIRQYLWT